MHNLTREQSRDHILLRPLDKAGLASYRATAEAFVSHFLDASGFESEFGATVMVPDQTGKVKEVLVGLEKQPEDPRFTVHLFAKLAGDLVADKVYRIDPALWPETNWEQATVGWGMGAYAFTRYRESFSKPAILQIPAGVEADKVERLLDSVFLARDLVNTPACDMSPQDLGRQAEQIAAESDGEIRIISGDDLLAENFPAIYVVGQASAWPPALIDLRWGDPTHPKLTLVGKGVVFDSGGLNLKPDAGMILMKKDMGGAAVTLSLARMVMRQNLPVRLRLLIPTVENAVSSNSYRPSDVIKTRKGLSVEIGNTDAEGRLILCDALTEAVSESPDLIIDMATLTGAARIALGEDLPLFYTHSDHLAGSLLEAATEVADPIWRMPLWRPYLRNLKSEIADLNNISNTPFGGSITAAVYLNEFVKPFENWIHFDIYGWRKEALPGSPKGGEATALRAVYRFLEKRYTH